MPESIHQEMRRKAALPNPFDRPSYAELEAKNARLLGSVEILQEALKNQRKLTEEAIAHDRQPYPTADAYNKVCEALHKATAPTD